MFGMSTRRSTTHPNRHDDLESAQGINDAGPSSLLGYDSQRRICCLAAYAGSVTGLCKTIKEITK